MIMKLKLAIIGSGRMAWIVGGNAREMGIETYCFSNVLTPYIKENVDHFIDISIFEKDKIVDICKENGVNGVIATTELTVAIAAYIAEKLGTPSISYEIATLITDKYRNRIACKGVIELSQPAFYSLKDSNELSKVTCPFPVIVKPTGKGGKKGITVVNNQGELSSAYSYAKENSGDAPVIIEQFISGGQEYSVESLSCKGKHYIVQVTEKISSGPPHCVELGHHQPALLTDSMRKKVEKALSKGLTAIGVDNSTCHTEIKIVGEDIYLIEFNARPGGDHIAWPLTELSTGYNLIKGAISIALNCFDVFDTAKLNHDFAGVYFVTKQTAHLKPIFDSCDNEPWLYHKNNVSDELQTLEHNDCYGTNSIMYFSKEKRIEL